MVDEKEHVGEKKLNLNEKVIWYVLWVWLRVFFEEVEFYRE